MTEGPVRRRSGLMDWPKKSHNFTQVAGVSAKIRPSPPPDLVCVDVFKTMVTFASEINSFQLLIHLAVNGTVTNMLQHHLLTFHFSLPHVHLRIGSWRPSGVQFCQIKHASYPLWQGSNLKSCLAFFVSVTISRAAEVQTQRLEAARKSAGTESKFLI